MQRLNSRPCDAKQTGEMSCKTDGGGRYRSFQRGQRVNAIFSTCKDTVKFMRNAR